MPTIRPATMADRVAVATTWADAFAYDPMFQWVLGLDREVSMERKLRPLFSSMAKLELGHDDNLVFTADAGDGAALWKRPKQWRMPKSDQLRAVPALLRTFTTRTPRLLEVFSVIEAAHPADEHYYLETIGTRQGTQGKGVGGALIRPMLERCDAEGMPAYLESSNVQNVPFYARHGFEVTSELDIGEAAPTVTAMWRDPS